MRKLDELQDGCMARAGDQEMTFVLLSRDITAPSVIRYWTKLRILAGLNKPDDQQIIEALACADTMWDEGKRHKPIPNLEPVDASRIPKEVKP